MTYIELVYISSERILVVLAMESGIIKNVVLNLNYEIKLNDIDSITELLKEKLLGLTLKDINKTFPVLHYYKYEFNNKDNFEKSILDIYTTDDIDPNKVQFVGTGVWDDKVFFDEPALQGAIFSGIEEKNRQDFFEDYKLVVVSV